MEWLKYHMDLIGHPKLIRLSDTLGVTPSHAVGLLIVMWGYAVAHAPDGDLSNFTPKEIARFAGWDGDPDVFVTALLECGGKKAGFLERGDDGLRLHDWGDYCGNDIQRYEGERDRKRRGGSKDAARGQQGDSEDVPGGFQGKGEEVPSDLHGNGAELPRNFRGTSTEMARNFHGDSAPKIEIEIKKEIEIKTKTKRLPSSPNGEDEVVADAPTAPGPQEPAPLAPLPEAGDGHGCTLSQVIRLWNEELGPLGFPKVAKGTPARDRCFSARVGEQAERRDLEWWRERIAQLAASDFMRSSARDKANWLNFDWLLNESNLVKVVEGRYANGKSLPARSGGARSSPPSARDAPMTYEEAVAKFRGSSTAVDVEYIDVEEG